MQTVRQTVCPHCKELNLPFLSVCAYCGQPLPAPAPLPPFVAPPSHVDADLGPLVWALVCCFLAIWGLVIAGPLQGLLGALTHPYLLIAWVVVSLIVTGAFLAERLTHETPHRALLSTRGLMALCWTAAALLAAGQGLRFAVPPMPVITRYQMLPKEGDGCRVEVFISGKPGDELWRLTELNRRSDKEIIGVIVRHGAGGSSRLPLTKHTPEGDCTITKYRLMIDGKESDQVDGLSGSSNGPR